ncbi:MAG: glycosyltransferase family 4 protein [Cellvibrionaceae bacterium]|nr:glycosyltransferase family 4 protein [Cellvibrionaceae bacterium]
MRLAYFTNTYPRATDTFIRREVIGLRKRGFEVLTFSVRKTGSDHDVDAEVISEKANTTYLLPCSPFTLFADHAKALISKPVNYCKTLLLALKTSRPGIKGHALQLVYFAEAILLARRVQEQGVEHLHNHLGDNSGTVTLLAASFADISYSISIHGPHIFFDGLHWALDTKTQYAKFIACIGHFCTSQMMLYTDKQDWHKFNIVRCGIDPQQFEFKAPARTAKKLVYVGRLSGEKGVPVLFESLVDLKQQNYDFHLTLLGDGEDRQQLEQLTREYQLQAHIHFAGFVDQATIANTLADSDIFVLPSFAEGIPVALMEAMARGVPVITTYVGGIPELIIDKVTGQLVYPADKHALSQAIAYYIDNPDACIEIAKNAREKVVNEFDINQQVDKLAQLFSQ